MKTLKPVTERVFEDEPCYLYAEHVFEEADGEHRYRIITVLRGCGPGCCGTQDAGLHLADFVEDMGAAKNFRVGPFRIPGGVKELNAAGEITNFHIEHVVDEMREMAEAMHQSLWPEYKPTLMKDLADTLDNRKKLITGRSTFGHGGALVRGI